MTTSQQDPILTGGLNTHCEQKGHFIVVRTWTHASISDMQKKKEKKEREKGQVTNGKFWSKWSENN